MQRKSLKLLICIFYAHTLYAGSDNPCNDILNIVNSPSNLDSACSVPFKKVLIELNYIDQQVNSHQGVQQNFPNAEIRFGLPFNSEFLINPPNYIHQKSFPKSGISTTLLALKHSIYYNPQWMFALEEIVNTPGGSSAYGSHGWGSTLNGTATFTINEHLSIDGMLGISRLSDSSLNGGNHFNSINPDIVITYSLNERIDIYGEVYGQSKISAKESAGYNFDGGIIFLLYTHTVLSISGGQQLYNYLGSFTHYINFGMYVML
ncbi:transporter [Legionella sainthelensi]|uniref:Transporter n=1 Tax=Legionella sainthelensi TaxID=28087 RepID=A0A2H5FKJ1_9GAMM|nr:transporter [Legionella sainthelensi]AUH72045.1 transporter [Legionella sainthelensi]